MLPGVRSTTRALGRTCGSCDGAVLRASCRRCFRHVNKPTPITALSAPTGARETVRPGRVVEWAMDVVSDALDAVPRSEFLPGGDRWRAGHDGPIQIGHGQTNSQPRTVEAMLRLLEVEPGHHVLDVGAGSGWTTALLAHLTGPTGSVVGVELVPDLATWGGSNLARTSYDWASIRPAEPEVLGVPDVGAVRPDPGLRRATSMPSPSSTSSATGAGWWSRCAARCCWSYAGARSSLSPSTGPTGSCRCAECDARLDHDPEQQHEHQPADREHRLHDRPRLDGLTDAEAEVLLHQPEARRR